MPARATCMVKSFKSTKGYGTIRRELDDDVLIHCRAIRGEGHHTCPEG
ncbi:cold shock domain-containing protein [Phytohalomonas tamaricis]